MIDIELILLVLISFLFRNIRAYFNSKITKI